VPRLTALRVAALERLAAELRFTPRARVLEILRRAESLAATTSPDDVVDERDLVRALTGYTPDQDDPAAIPGDALLADLSALVERVSDAARIRAADLPGAVAAGELARRWGISEKTLARRRREGLVAWRVRAPSGKVALRYTPEAAEAFRRAQTESAPAAPRLSASDRRRLARAAAALERRFGWARTRAAKAIASKHGRAYETVRRALERELGPPRARAGARSRAGALARWRRGEPVAGIARDAGRSPATARRWIDDARARAVLALNLPPAEPPLDPAAAERALASPAAATNLLVKPATRAADFVASARAAPPANPAETADLAAAHTALLLRARAAAEGARADEAETAIRWAGLLRRKLVHRHRRLALAAIESAIGGELLRLPAPAVRALHREAMRAVAEGVASHDARRGGSVAGPINVALTRRLARAPETRDARRALAGRDAARAALSDAPLDDWGSFADPWRDPLGPASGPLLAPGTLAGDPALTGWASLRLGLGGEPPLTAEAAARRAGLTPQRAARLDRALRALAR